MTFMCPACKEVMPLDEGLIVMEHAPHSRRKSVKGYGPGRANNQTPPVVAILCGPCTGEILVQRAKA